MLIYLKKKKRLWAQWQDETFSSLLKAITTSIPEDSKQKNFEIESLNHVAIMTLRQHT